MDVHHVCALVKTCANGILVVSRRDNWGAFGMPGGKIEVGETPEQAIVRELKEEVDLTVNESDLQELYTGEASLGDQMQTGLNCRVYWVNIIAPYSNSFVNSENCLVCSFKDFSELLKDTISPFYIFNNNFLQHMKYVDDTDAREEWMDEKRDQLIEISDAVDHIVKQLICEIEANTLMDLGAYSKKSQLAKLQRKVQRLDLWLAAVFRNS